MFFSIINHFLPISSTSLPFKYILVSPISKTKQTKKPLPGPLLAIVSLFFSSNITKPLELSVLHVISPRFSLQHLPDKTSIHLYPQTTVNHVTNDHYSNISQPVPQQCYVAQWFTTKLFISCPSIFSSAEVQTRVSLGLIQVICLVQIYSMCLSFGGESDGIAGHILPMVIVDPEDRGAETCYSCYGLGLELSTYYTHSYFIGQSKSYGHAQYQWGRNLFYI